MRKISNIIYCQLFKFVKFLREDDDLVEWTASLFLSFVEALNIFIIIKITTLADYIEPTKDWRGIIIFPSIILFFIFLNYRVYIKDRYFEVVLEKYKSEEKKVLHGILTVLYVVISVVLIFIFWIPKN